MAAIRSTICCVLMMASVRLEPVWGQNQSPALTDPRGLEVRGPTADPIPTAIPDQAEAPAPRTNDSMGGFGGAGGFGGRGPSYAVTWYPSSAVSGQMTDLGGVEQSLTLGAPVWRNDSDMVNPSDDFRMNIGIPFLLREPAREPSVFVASDISPIRRAQDIACTVLVQSGAGAH